MMRSADIHGHLAGRWREILVDIGIDRAHLRKKQGPCPACGGTDRFSFDDRKGRGDFICRRCGAGDGFALVMRVTGCDFATARRRVLEVAGLRDVTETMRPVAPTTAAQPAIAQPSRRVRDLLRTSCAVETCDEAMRYLGSRGLLPLPEKHRLRAHTSAEYFDEGRCVGHFAALVAPVHDVDGDLVTAHITYLEAGRKLKPYEPRKLLSPLSGREGCAVRLAPICGDTLGIGEGIETCLAAAHIHDVPTWAALNTALLAKFEPPTEVKRLLIFADADVPGLTAAAALMQRLQGWVALEMHAPSSPAKDWADAVTKESIVEVST